jgi:hypothetical protein
LTAHLAHLKDEVRHGLRQRLLLQIALDLVPVFHRPDITQRSAEEGHQAVLVPPGRHGGEDLIEVQITEH